jgi:enoyl-CoA hydratase
MSESEVIFETRGPIGVITMTRPKALNALTLGMIELMAPQLAAWAEDDGIKALVIRGEGEKAFCAGGDVRAVWEAGREAKAAGTLVPGKPGQLTADFFRAEYKLNRQIFKFPKPYIALIDGITMGGGVGLSVHGSHRVAGDRTMIAMPETAIGLFPDVGGGYFLPRLPGEMGVFLALTGERVKAADAVALGIATHYVPSDRGEGVLDALVGADWSGDPRATADLVLSGLSGDPGETAIAARHDEIDAACGKARAEEIAAAMAEGSEFLQGCARRLEGFSPTSMKLALAQVRKGGMLDFDACMTMEYRLSQACMAGHDFYEGIRALLVDKDKNPRWQPASLEEVDDAEIDAMFAPLGEYDLTFED